MIIPSVRAIRPSKTTHTFHLCDAQVFLLMPIGDIQFGHPGCVPERLRRHIEWGVKRGAWFLGMGDYFDFGSESQSAILRTLREEQQAQLEDLLEAQVEQLAAILAPSKGRWLGMLAGNHNFAGVHGFSEARMLARAMECDWLADMAHIRVRLGREMSPSPVLNIYCHHGLGGGRRAGSGLLRLEDMVPFFPEGDIYLMGHNHTKVNTPLDPLHTAPNGVLYHRTKILARTGSWLRGYRGQPPPANNVPDIETRGSYIERGCMSAAALGGIVIGVGQRQVKEAEVWTPDLHVAV